MIKIFCNDKLHNFVIHEMLLGWPNQGMLEGCVISSGRYGTDKKKHRAIQLEKKGGYFNHNILYWFSMSKSNPLKHMTCFLRYNCTLGSLKCHARFSAVYWYELFMDRHHNCDY